MFNTELKIVADNQTENKDIGQIYKEFKQKYKIPKNYYEIIKNNPHFLFYYSAEEQREYLKQFHGKIIDIEYTPLSSDIQLYPSLNEETSEEEKKKAFKNQYEINRANDPLFSNCACETCIIKKNAFLSNKM